MFEYKSLKIDASEVEANIDQKVNELAKQGWELENIQQKIVANFVPQVSKTDSYLFIFKRKVQ